MAEEISKDNSQNIVEERKKKFLNLFAKKNLWVWVVLAVIIFLGLYIRTRNMYGLKDITTGQWTLGPDLDPFLFMRWAKYIVEHGSLMKIDYMRNVPLGFNTAIEMVLLPYLIAWFYEFLSFFSKNVTVDYASVIFPVFFFALTILSFFLLVRKIFSEHFKDNKLIPNLIALIASAFLTVLPSLLSRTIAGIPEKESAGFFFMFLAFYLFLVAWKSNGLKKIALFAVLSGIATTCMALIWGGVVFIFMTIAISVFIAFLFGKVDNNKVLAYFLWLLASTVIVMLISVRFTLRNLVASSSTGAAFAVLFILLVDFALFGNKYKIGEKIKNKIKIPNKVISLLISFLILIIAVIIFLGPSFIVNEFKDNIDHLIHPFGTDRFTLTVAENRQPYFIDEWRGSFGPIVIGIPLFFWLFFIGSIFLFWDILNKIEKKERIILTLAYALFLFALIFSRYSPQGSLDGVSGLSKTVYFGGMLLLIASFVYVYYKYYKIGKAALFKEIDFSYLILFILFFLTIVAARGGVRLIMILAPIATIIVAYFSVSFFLSARKNKDELMRSVMIAIAIIILIASAYTFYNYAKTSYDSAQIFVPNIYTQQWQKAMAWVRDNTPENAVFAHWWDYGYWLQSMGNRATVLDGGNAITYWDYFMGRHVLTGTSEEEALGFLYAHNATHLLIDSTDIGKYPAFSSIGADENYDRYSWIYTFLLDDKSTQEMQNETIYVYPGGSPLDEDSIWNENGQQILLPSGKAYVAAILLRMQGKEIKQPEAVIAYQDKQIRMPLRYAYYNEKLYDFSNGSEAGIFIFPRLIQQGQGIQVNDIGALLYLSKRTVNTNLVRLYLFNQGENFKLVHNESNLIMQNLRQQGLKIGEFAYYNDLLGPIKIWEINYPSDIKFNPDYLEKGYPSESLRMSR